MRLLLFAGNGQGVLPQLRLAVGKDTVVAERTQTLEGRRRGGRGGEFGEDVKIRTPTP